MNLTTKFQPGDSAFRLHDNKVQEVEIASVEVHVARNPISHQPEVNTRYWLRVVGDSADRVCHELLLFTTKLELLESL